MFYNVIPNWAKFRPCARSALIARAEFGPVVTSRVKKNHFDFVCFLHHSNVGTCSKTKVHIKDVCAKKSLINNFFFFNFDILNISTSQCIANKMKSDPGVRGIVFVTHIMGKLSRSGSTEEGKMVVFKGKLAKYVVDYNCATRFSPIRPGMRKSQNQLGKVPQQSDLITFKNKTDCSYLSLLQPVLSTPPQSEPSHRQVYGSVCQPARIKHSASRLRTVML